MNKRAEIRNFLATRRAKLTSEQVRAPDLFPPARIPAAREEVAVLAGVSTDW
ncbi:hypothetical protein M6B22_06465 [Jatrophihabitans cynanchi]|uniref:5-formyltetrahydrofolate cyclo-ligase n=1 Tax=Jatrophihabitans cynanchi TaxID=2944128 RepID=A0ABY7K0L9_9ACTN|nr:hypothetical protein [Jatrophihabitans sp. SB3-54]WAX58404.1 hypothetical protein M6B22_06465 [Jatrophihabitans sp. SB3-54]